MSKHRPTKRHFIDIYRPGTQLDERGNPTGADDTEIAKEIPASVVELRGQENEAGEQLFGAKQIDVTFYGDPAWELKSRDYILFGSRRLEILEVRDPRNVALEIVCVCGEITD